MAMLLDQDKYYFTYSNDKYLPNRASDVQKIKDFHLKSIKDKEDIISLVTKMDKNVLPEKLTPYQHMLYMETITNTKT